MTPSNLHWLRLYCDLPYNRKLNRLPEPVQLRYVKILCLHRAGHYETATAADLGYELRISEAEAVGTLAALKSAGLLEPDGRIHNWNVRQFASDDVTARTRKHRQKERERSAERSGNVPGNGQNRTEQNRTEKSPDGSPASAGSPRAPVGRKARKAKAADQPALLPPEPTPARQADPDKLPTDNPLSHPGRLARLLAGLILARDSKARVPDPARKRDERGLNKWAREIDKIHRLDNRDWPEIERIIRFCQADPFWRGNILSAAKLRKQFTALVAQADRGKPAAHPAKSLPALDEAVSHA